MCKDHSLRNKKIDEIHVGLMIKLLAFAAPGSVDSNRQ